MDLRHAVRAPPVPPRRGGGEADAAQDKDGERGEGKEGHHRIHGGNLKQQRKVGARRQRLSAGLEEGHQALDVDRIPRL